MMKRYYSWVAVVGLLAFSIAFFAVVRSGSAKVPPPQQFPIMDQVANKVIAKYQNSTCEQLWIKKSEKAPPTAEEVKAITFLKSDPQMRAAFINKIAAPIANKMFECGMIP
jgi:hypothetical protein